LSLALALLLGAALIALLFPKSLIRRNAGRSVTRTSSRGARNDNSSTPPLGETEAAPGNDDKAWWENADYFWVVLCKNGEFHNHENPSHAHRIPLGQTDSVLSLPISKPFKVRCNLCGKENVYAPSDVMRWEMKAPERFVPHPLFRD